MITGGGFGHGVGMSQWGAQGQALQGRGYRAIVGSYFPGTKVATPRIERTLRVRLTAAPSASFSGASKAGTRTLNPRTTYRARLVGARVELRGGGRTVTIPTRAAVTGRGPLTVAGLGRYRGALELSAAADANDVRGNVQVVNRVGVEDYLRGVVTQEAYGSWKPAALAAQAVVSRTYAVAVVKAGTVGYDQFADTRSQKYSGVAGESATGDRAVRATRGQVVTYRGRAVPVFFHASSGGRTDSAEEGFGMTPQPWLVSVADPADATPANKSAQMDAAAPAREGRAAAAQSTAGSEGRCARSSRAGGSPRAASRPRRSAAAAARSSSAATTSRSSSASGRAWPATRSDADQSAFSYSTIDVSDPTWS